MTDVAQVKTIVSHLVISWQAVLRQRQYMQSMGSNPRLIAALEHTYAAHVHNAVGVALVMDLIRAVGALILDRRKGTASLYKAVGLLGKPNILRAVAAQMTEVKHGRFADESAVKALGKAFGDHAEDYYNQAQADLRRIECEVFRSVLADTLEAVRNNAVAHNHLIHDGADWKLWYLEGTGVTYGQLDEFIDLCTKAIDRLAHLILRQSHAFAVESLNAQLYAAHYVEALVIGLERISELRAARSQQL